MKRARIMLLAIAAFATVGTALAFKVQKLGQTQYCFKITDEVPNAGDCVTGIEKATAQRNSGSMLYYTTTTDFTLCEQDDELVCTTTALGFIE
jgi:hypothetical protein